MSIEWSKDRVESLSTQEILALQANARDRGNLEVVAACDEVLSTKKRPHRSSHSRSATPINILKAECAGKLSEFAKLLLIKYDLSAATAIKNSVGTKGFIAHKLTAKDGNAKLGGDQRTGKVAIDLYISYRVRNEPISLVALLISEDPENELVWQVLGPQRFLKNFKSYSEIRPYALGTDGNLYAGGEEFEDFAEAAAQFENLLSQVADELLR